MKMSNLRAGDFHPQNKATQDLNCRKGGEGHNNMANLIGLNGNERA